MPGSPPAYSLIVLAAGSGSRMGSPVPKQFLDVGGRRLLDRAIDPFRGVAAQIVVAVPHTGDDVQPIDGVTTVQGGQTRTQSVAAALDHVTEDFVLVHDAARPFVTGAVVDRILDALAEVPCACPVMPVVNSLVVETDGHLVESPSRSQYRDVQTPQGFHTGVLREAIARFGDDHAHLPELVRRLGHPVRHTEGSPWLFKLTYEPNVHLAEYYLSHYPATPIDGRSGGS